MLVGWTETLRDDCLNAVTDYYTGRMDNSIISFGKTGKSILSRLSARAVMGTELVSVESCNNLTNGSIISNLGERILRGFKDEVDHMEYMRSLSTKFMRGKVALDFISGNHKMEKLSVDEKEFNLRPDDTSSRILSSTASSSSYILVSNFGEMISQRMHIAFSKLLSRKGIPHLNVITVPQNSRQCNVEMALSGVEELRNSGGKVVTFEEIPYMKNGRNSLTGEFHQMVAKRVNEFSRKLAAKANLLKMQMVVS